MAKNPKEIAKIILLAKNHDEKHKETDIIITAIAPTNLFISTTPCIKFSLKIMIKIMAIIAHPSTKL